MTPDRPTPEAAGGDTEPTTHGPAEPAPDGATPGGPLHGALLFCTATQLAVWTLLLVDGLRVVARGVPPGALTLLHGIALPIGWSLALVLGSIAAAAWSVGWVFDRGLRRLGPRLPPSRWVAVALGVLVVGPLHTAHETMVKHPLIALLVSGYTAALFALLALFVDRHRPALARWPRLVLLGGLMAGVGIHTVNATAYVNLYDELHRGLTAVTALGWLAVWRVVLAHRTRRTLVLLAAALTLSGGLALGAAGALKLDRAGLVVYGTESRHALELLDLYLDGDGDRVAAAPVGVDCDDDDPKVHPLRFEVPGNGRDDNCRLGDAPKARSKRPPPLRPDLPLSPGARDWRAAHPAPDVVLIFVDTLRADALGRGDSPNIDAFAARSARFTGARSTVSRTPHAWMGLIRARFLERTLLCRRRLRKPGAQTLIHRMRAAGWRTKARLVGGSWPRFHLADGWDVLRMRGHVNRRSSKAAATEGLRWLAAGGQRLFAVLHFADPHVPHRDGAGRRHPGPLIDGYRGEVRHTDAQIGRVLDAIAARTRPTLVVLFADHGENLGERGMDGGHHGGSVFDEVSRVPLIVGGTGIPTRTIDDPVSLADIAPTILELTGQPQLPGADGRSLAGLIFDDGPAPGPSISGYFDAGHRLRSIVDGRLKLIVDARRGARLLFDVVADPGETTDLKAQRPDDLARLQGQLDRWLEYEADRVGASAGCKDLAVGR